MPSKPEEVFKVFLSILLPFIVSTGKNVALPALAFFKWKIAFFALLSSSVTTF